MKNKMTNLFTLNGVVPSKKNAWRRGKNGNVYVNDQIQADIDALVIQARVYLNRMGHAIPKGDSLEIWLYFWVKKMNKDLDNMVSTLLDVLQKGQIVENDKLFHCIHAEQNIGPSEKVDIRIEVIHK